MFVGQNVGEVCLVVSIMVMARARVSALVFVLENSQFFCPIPIERRAHSPVLLSIAAGPCCLNRLNATWRLSIIHGT